MRTGPEGTRGVSVEPDAWQGAYGHPRQLRTVIGRRGTRRDAGCPMTGPACDQALIRSDVEDAGTSSPIEIGFRLLHTTAATMISAATIAMITRSGVFASSPMLHATTAG